MAASEAERIFRATFTVGCLLLAPLAMGWGAFLWALGNPNAAVIPGGYAVLTALMVAFYARTGLFDFLRISQLGLLLTLPGLLQLSMGGYAPSGGVVIHSLLCPLAALLYFGPRAARGWLFAWVAAMFMTARFEPAGLMPVNRLLMSLNLGGFGILVFLLVRHAMLVHAMELRSNKSTI